MAKNTFLSFDTTASNNTDIAGIDIQGTAAVMNFDNAFRQLMAILRTDLDNGQVFVTKAAGYTALAADNNAFYEFTAAATLALTAAATLAADWHMMVFANGGAVTINPDGAELINGAATLVVADGDAAYVICTGTAFKAITIPGVTGVAKLSTENTFTKTQIWAKGADVASANALALGDDGNYFDVTGTTAITSIDTVGAGAWVKLHFDGILTLTHHSTDLVLPGGANITTAAGDEAEFVEYATGDWRCTNYQKASGSAITLGTVQASTSGATIDFTGIPAWAKQVIINFAGVSLSGTGIPLVRIGDSGGIENTGYLGAGGDVIGGSGAVNTTGFAIGNGYVAATVFNGSVTLTLMDPATNTWAAAGVIGVSSGAQISVVAGSKALSAPLDRIQAAISTAVTYDAGSINIAYH